MSSMNIAVTGANGQLGSAIHRLSGAYPFTFFFTDAETLDITDAKAVRNYLRSNAIDAVINTAAYTAVDKAESDEEAALRINGEAVRNLGLAAAESHCRLIHISTDYVFNGIGRRPYTESDPTCPVSAYGRTKLAGEQAIQESGAEAIILRTAWLYAETGNNFLHTMLRLGRERSEVRVVTDQRGTPTSANDLAQAILTILQQAEQGVFKAGLYHYSAEGECSWYDFAARIMELAQLPCRVLPITTADYPTPAARPTYSVLDKSKIKEAYGLHIPNWEESLQKVIEKVCSQTR
jgi:dTDP-4-dehydrorhamnose reductase